MHKTKYLFIVFIAVVVLHTHVQAEYLSVVWPRGYKSGQFDKLKLKFVVGQKLTLLSGSRWCLIEGEMIHLESPAIRDGKDWQCPPDLVRHLQRLKGKL